MKITFHGVKEEDSDRMMSILDEGGIKTENFDVETRPEEL